MTTRDLARTDRGLGGAGSVAFRGMTPPLLLPMPAQPLDECRCEPRHLGTPLCDRPTSAISTWDRWVLAHHASFTVWRLTAEYLRLAQPRRPASSLWLARAADLFDIYSCLLLYGASCSLEEYATIIRPGMAAAHPGFSGTWARDFEYISGLLRQYPPSTDSDLKRAVRFNRLVHGLVAKRLVPDGASLLRESGHVEDTVTDAERDLFDDVFRTVRRSICREHFTSQVIGCADAIGDDVRTRQLCADYAWPGVNAVQNSIHAYLHHLRWIAQDFATLRAHGTALATCS
jgi:hypothetical protein